MRKGVLFCVLLLTWALSGQSVYRSWEGPPNGMSPHCKLRALNIFVNIYYDENPTRNQIDGSDYWPQLNSPSQAGINVKGTIPSYLLDLMDVEYNPQALHGCITRVYGEASLHNLQITGDFVVVNLLESRILRDYKVFNYATVCKASIDVINETGGLRTIYGHNSIADYTQEQDRIAFYQILIRNITNEYGGLKSNRGFNMNVLSEKKILVEGKEYPMGPVGTIQGVGSGDITRNPTSIVVHEISHSLFGGNSFHTSGGNHRRSYEPMVFMTVQGGYGLMGGANSGLVGCNGYERWRMHWRNQDIPSDYPSYICARDVSNSIYLSSDVTKEDGNISFFLRDFMTTGDAVRIKLPYKSSTDIPNQYIWLEFHDVGHNGTLDYLQYSDETCLSQGTPGIYAYYQVGRDVLESSNKNDVWDQKHRDNLRIISSEGFWDYTQYALPYDTNFVCTQWNWDKYYYVPEYSNAFGGYQDQERFLIPKDYDMDLANTQDSVIEGGRFLRMKPVIREVTMQNKVVRHTKVTHNISFLGDSRDAFSSPVKLNMGTNPSTCNTKTCYSSSDNGITHLTFPLSQYNEQTTYLSGLGIEMSPVEERGWVVRIRWDDYGIENARWTGTIVLQEQLRLKKGNVLQLAQNRTPSQRYRDEESGYFSPVTTLTCLKGSLLELEEKSILQLMEQSRLILKSGSELVLGDHVRVKVQGGARVVIEPDVAFKCGKKSTLIIGAGSTCVVPNRAQLESQCHVVVRPGGTILEK